ncbi:MAG: rubrerythrin family protein [Bacteroidales bacterium]|nr:rubrerythrin family protein [Bacteroidales bacterium]MBD5217802.1 rubrerythrin family protein [Bacteroidales bacterium]MBD5221669.1 rubrerythrin family protein [Bacteroidales bacterium]
MATTKSIKGTKTEINLANAYVAESTAYTRYTFYAQQANKEQYYQISNIFNETADNELHHAKIFLKYLEESAVAPATTIDNGILGSTLNNLRTAASEEETEGVDLYKKAADVADEEGFPEIAEQFRAIASIEEHHRRRFLELADQVEKGTVWKREKPIKWQCLVCGYIFEGTTPPEVCPACKHPYQHYEALGELF